MVTTSKYITSSSSHQSALCFVFVLVLLHSVTIHNQKHSKVTRYGPFGQRGPKYVLIDTEYFSRADKTYWNNSHPTCARKPDSSTPKNLKSGKKKKCPYQMQWRSLWSLSLSYKQQNKRCHKITNMLTMSLRVILSPHPALCSVPAKLHFTNDYLVCMKTSETISDSAECYAGLSVRFESSAACMLVQFKAQK